MTSDQLDQQQLSSGSGILDLCKFDVGPRSLSHGALGSWFAKQPSHKSARGCPMSSSVSEM